MAAQAISFLRPSFGPAPAPPGAGIPATGIAVGPNPTPFSDSANTTEPTLAGLAGYIRDCYKGAADNRRNLGVDDRMMDALRALRGEYDDQTMSDIRAFGGSEVYARITASKVRACAAMLREIYTATDRPWSLSPTPDPQLAGPTLDEAVRAVMMAEVQEVAASGMPLPDIAMLKSRAAEVKDELLQQRRKVATTALETRTAAIDDVLWEGNFYEALWAFLGDIATFPFAVIKGPIVRQKNVLVWKKGVPGTERRPMPEWDRCSPFDVYFAPWSQFVQDGYIIHRERINRSALQALKGLPNYDNKAIERVLANWSTTGCDWYDYNETERADLEQRESAQFPTYAAEGNERPLPMLSFYGTISRQMYANWSGKTLEGEAADDISIFAYLIGNEVIGVTPNPHPTGRLPFYGDSFERVPGSCYGNAIPDLIGDVQAVGNASLRALVNNLSIASGPMGWINEDRLAANDPNAKKLWPWKMFSFNDPLSSTSNTEKPMEFFQPDNNVQELLMTYQSFMTMADELSTIPRYMSGSGGGVGGAGRTAAGLSMLMENSNRTIKQTVSSIDNNVIEMAVEDLNVYLALTRPDVVMEGDISVVARGAVELMQKETLRMRRLEFLNITNNPIDQQLVGVEGRFNILKEVARDLGIPTADSLALNSQQAEQISQMMLQQALGANGGGPGGNQVPPPMPQGQPTPPQQGVARPPTNAPGA